MSFLDRLTDLHMHMAFLGFPCSSDSKESACNARGPGSIPELGRSPWRRKWLRMSWEDHPGEGNGYPLQYPCLENPVDRGGW